MMPGKGFAKGIERAGADIAEHHADRADRKLQLAVAVMRVAGMVRIGGGRGAVRAGCPLLRLRSHGAGRLNLPRLDGSVVVTAPPACQPAMPDPSPRGPARAPSTGTRSGRE